MVQLLKYFPYGNRSFQEDNTALHHSKVVAATRESAEIVMLLYTA
ncbi:1059_t:CDS:2 [Funneliformis geosporum]|nr:1059_t:CDS:2 [Funneliformis geosporum]